jgi:hypothetical protein
VDYSWFEGVDLSKQPDVAMLRTMTQSLPETMRRELEARLDRIDCTKSTKNRWCAGPPEEQISREIGQPSQIADRQLAYFRSVGQAACAPKGDKMALRALLLVPSEMRGNKSMRKLGTFATSSIGDGPIGKEASRT